MEEVRSQLRGFISHNYLDEKVGEELIAEYTELIKGINAYIKFLKNKQREKQDNQ